MPFGGVYIFAKNIKNEGRILSEGKTAVTHIQTDKYSGKGEVSAKSVRSIKNRNKKLYQNPSIMIPLIGLVVAIISIPWWPQIFQKISGSKKSTSTIIQQPTSASTNNKLGP